MKAKILPEKQLRYVLKKQGFEDVRGGDFCNKDYVFVGKTFKLCLKEIEIFEIGDEGDFYNYIYKEDSNTNYFLNKDWFIPNSFIF